MVSPSLKHSTLAVTTSPLMSGMSALHPFVVPRPEAMLNCPLSNSHHLRYVAQQVLKLYPDAGKGRFVTGLVERRHRSGQR